MIEPETLQKYSLFGGLLEDQVTRVMEFIEYNVYEADATLMKEGERNDKIYFILEGRVQIVKEDMVLVELGVGDTVGEMEVLDVMPSAATGKVMERSRIASISNKALRQIFKLDPAIFSLMIMNLARDLSRRLRRMDEWYCREEHDGVIPEAPGPKKAQHGDSSSNRISTLPARQTRPPENCFQKKGCPEFRSGQPLYFSPLVMREQTPHKGRWSAANREGS